jgi:hypothetical protein
MGVPVDARPIAVRKVRCSGIRRFFDCRYIVDYGRNGTIEGSYEQRNVTVGKNQNGEWSKDWITLRH